MTTNVLTRCHAVSVRLLCGALCALTLFALPQVSQGQGKRILAVLEIKNNSERFSPNDIQGATNYLRGLLVRHGMFSVVDKGRMEEHRRAVLQELKRDTANPCYDDRCRVRLGQALSADSLLACTIDSVGDTCTLNCELVPLATEVAESGGAATFPCDPNKLLGAVESVVGQLHGASELVQDSQPLPDNEPSMTKWKRRLRCSETSNGVALLGWCKKGSYYGPLHVGSIVYARVDRSFYGAAQVGVFTSVEEDFWGALQIGAIYNRTKSFQGIISFGIYNHIERFRGVWHAGIYNKTNKFQGLFQAFPLLYVPVPAAFNEVETDFQGLLQAAAYNWVKRDLLGIQLGGFNRVGRNAKGLQLGLFNLVEHDSWTLPQLGAFNWVQGSAGGLQIGGYNLVKGNMRGVQFGVANRTREEIAGVQLGLYNRAKIVSGVQLGVVNRTEKLNGVQIGVANIATRNGMPFFVGINFTMAPW